MKKPRKELKDCWKKEGIIKRPFFHWNIWIWSRYNKRNAERLKEVDELRDLILFLEQVYMGGIVPNKLFREKASVRVTSLCTEKIPENLIVRESRFLKYQPSKKKLSNHNKTLIPILENDENSLCIELPVWCEKMFYEGKWMAVTGHIDLLQYCDEDKKVYIWDYKPDYTPGKPHIVYEQVKFYKFLLSQLVFLEPKNIVCGWFNDQNEFIVKDYE